MPKDEDVLQLVSVSMGFFMHLIPRATCITRSHTFHYIISQGCCVVLVCRVRHRSTSSPWKNVEIFLEWLHSDSEARCSVFRLQHAFIKSHWCPDRESFTLKNSLVLIHTPMYCTTHFCRSTGCSTLAHMIRHASSLVPPINLEQHVNTQNPDHQTKVILL